MYRTLKKHQQIIFANTSSIPNLFCITIAKQNILKVLCKQFKRIGMEKLCFQNIVASKVCQRILQLKNGQQKINNLLFLKLVNSIQPPMNRDYFYDPYLVDVVPLLDNYFVQKLNNSKIHAWMKLKDLLKKKRHQKSKCSLYQPNSSAKKSLYNSNITPKQEKLQGTAQSLYGKNLKTQKLQNSLLEKSIRGYKDEDISNYQSNQDFEDEVLQKLLKLQTDIKKLKESRGVETVQKRLMRSSNVSNTGKSEITYLTKENILEPKYVRMGKTLEKDKLMIKDLLEDKQNINFNIQEDFAPKANLEVKSSKTDRWTPDFKEKKNSLIRQRKTQKFQNNNKKTEKNESQMEYQKTLRQLYADKEERISQVQSVHQSSIYTKPKCRCICTCCSTDSFPIVKAVSNHKIGIGYYQLVPYKFQEKMREINVGKPLQNIQNQRPRFSSTDPRHTNISLHRNRKITACMTTK